MTILVLTLHNKWCRLSTLKTCSSWNYSKNNRPSIKNLVPSSTVLTVVRSVSSTETHKTKCQGTHSCVRRTGSVKVKASKRSPAILQTMWRFFNGEVNLWSLKCLSGTDILKVLSNKLPSTTQNNRSTESGKSRPRQKIWSKILERPSSDTSTRTNKPEWEC